MTLFGRVSGGITPRLLMLVLILLAGLKGTFFRMTQEILL
jgi:hypothetical protein